MPTVKKQEMVADLTALLRDSTSAIVTDYRGLTVADIAAVRRSLRERGITYRVIKNRLARIAARDAGLSELDSLLEGPSALAVGRVDEVVLARSFLEAVRPYRTVTVRGGLLRGRRIESAAVDRLATLPGRDVLLGQLAGGMAAPLSAMASLLSAPLRNLGYALQQVATQKAAAAPVAPVAERTTQPSAEASTATATPATEPAAETSTATAATPATGPAAETSTATAATPATEPAEAKTDKPAKGTPKAGAAVAEKGSETAAPTEPQLASHGAAPEPAPDATAEAASGDAASEPQTESA